MREEEVAKWTREGLPKEVLRRCRFWRRASLAIPLGREEKFLLGEEWATLKWRRGGMPGRGPKYKGEQVHRAPIPPLLGSEPSV